MNNDPLLAMRAKEQEALQRLLANPIKMKAIRGAVQEQQQAIRHRAISHRAARRVGRPSRMRSTAGWPRAAWRAAPRPSSYCSEASRTTPAVTSSGSKFGSLKSSALAGMSPALPQLPLPAPPARSVWPGW